MTSEEKSTCPGESMRLIKNSVPSVFCLMAPTSSLSTSKYIEIAVDLIVIPRSFSSSLVSVNRMSPAFAEAMIPAFDTRESVRVDLP